jgi:hypothetical protein
LWQLLGLRKQTFFLTSTPLNQELTWADRLQRAIKGASKFFIFWCDHSANSVEVRKEWMLALYKKKKIIPVLLDSTQLPPKLKKFQWLDLRDVGQTLHVPLRGAAGAQVPGGPQRSARFVVGIVVVLAVISLLASGGAFLGSPADPSGMLAELASVGGVIALIGMACVALGVFGSRMRRKKLYRLMAEKLKERLQAEALNDADAKEPLHEGQQLT